MSTRNLMTIAQFCAENPAFTQGGVRWQVFNALNNGLEDADAIVRIGRRVYLDIDKYFAWVESIQRRNVKHHATA